MPPKWTQTELSELRELIEAALQSFGYEYVEETTTPFPWTLVASIQNVRVGISPLRDAKLLQVDGTLKMLEDARQRFRDLPTVRAREDALSRIKILLLNSALDYQLRFDDEKVLEAVTVARQLTHAGVTTQSLFKTLKAVKDAFYKVLVGVESARSPTTSLTPTTPGASGSASNQSEVLNPKSWEVDLFPHIVVDQQLWDFLDQKRKGEEPKMETLRRLLALPPDGTGGID